MALEGHVQPLDLGAHLDAELGVEVGERLVEEEERGLAGDGAADGDALALAAGELLRLAVEQALDLQDLGGLRSTAAAISARGAPRIFRPKPRFCRTDMCG